MKEKKFEIGSISLVLFIIGILFTFTFNDICIGDNILTYIGLKAWSKGNIGVHYTTFYSLGFFIASLIISYKSKENLASKVCRILSTIMIVMILTVSLFFTLVTFIAFID